MLNSQAKALLDFIDSLNLPPVWEQTVEEVRHNYRERRYGTQPVAQEVAACVDHQVAMRDGQSILVREYRPQGSQSTSSLPALVYYHGGGWTIGDVVTHDTLCRELCNKSNCAVFSVDYRMGPEFKYPTAVHDAFDALSWVADQAASLRVDASRIAVGGDSAGGNLAAVAALGAREGLTSAVAFQLLIYPATTQHADTDSHQRNGDGYLLTSRMMDWFRDQYHGDPVEFDHWQASPLLADNLAGLPGALVLTAGYDPLVDEAEAYAQAMKAAGNEVSYRCFDGQIHGFITMGKVLDEATEAVDLCASALRSALKS